MKRTHRIAILAASALGWSLPGAALAKPVEDDVAARCAALSNVRLADTTIESAMLVPAKADETSIAGDVPGSPGFCRVVARVRSEPGSDIGVELWLPAQGWAGVFHGNGSGGFAGNFTLGYSGMAEGLRRGFATATTDAGTAPATPLEGDALIGHPRLGPAFHPRHDDHRQGADQGVLRQGSAQVLLHRLFDRRADGADRSAILSAGL